MIWPGGASLEPVILHHQAMQQDISAKKSSKLARAHASVFGSRPPKTVAKLMQTTFPAQLLPDQAASEAPIRPKLYLITVLFNETTGIETGNELKKQQHAPNAVVLPVHTEYGTFVLGCVSCWKEGLLFQERSCHWCIILLFV